MIHLDRWTNRKKWKKISVEPFFPSEEWLIRLTLNATPPPSHLLHCFIPKVYFTSQMRNLEG